MNNRMTDIDSMQDKINELIKENEELKRWQNSVNTLLNQMLGMMEQLGDRNDKYDIEREISELRTYANINRYRIDSLLYEIQDPDYRSFFFKPNILSVEETLRQIVEEKKSIARLGDGEFAAIVGQKRWSFQGVSEFLAEKLKEVLASEDDSMLIGLNPRFYMNLADIDEKDADAVRAYMRPMVRRLHASLLSPDKIYGNALFHSISTRDDVEKLKKIWDRKECVFIEGEYTRMGVGNDLFDNCGCIERILCPAENAIDRYDKIMEEALKHSRKKLMLLALGPTATVLAYELYKNGYQAIDIGHIDLIYEGFLRNEHDFNYVEIPYKYCKKNEWNTECNIEDIDDPVYKSQITAVI